MSVDGLVASVLTALDRARIPKHRGKERQLGRKAHRANVTDAQLWREGHEAIKITGFVWSVEQIRRQLS